MWSDEKCAEQMRIGNEAKNYLYEGVIVPTALFDSCSQAARRWFGVGSC